jgi:hypothetical protein
MIVSDYNAVIIKRQRSKNNNAAEKVTFAKIDPAHAMDNETIFDEKQSHLFVLTEAKHSTTLRL